MPSSPERRGYTLGPSTASHLARLLLPFRDSVRGHSGTLAQASPTHGQGWPPFKSAGTTDPSFAEVVRADDQTASLEDFIRLPQG